jgi:3-methylcrotonyl-CoA carboxylase alpha subunit
MIESLLIANRGEIACRIIRTCKKLGVRAIAVYSDADRNAPHVLAADEAVFIGPAPAAESYLDASKVLAAAKASGVQAIHPGYGFLSENTGFAQAVLDAGLVWVGPPPAAIKAMALKDAAKALMQAAGVPVTPGYLGEDQDDGRLRTEADRIGYPVLIKAVAGGGGKGMRKVEDTASFEAALMSCRREAIAAFGDGKVLIEKYIASPRHIEVQVFADRHGGAVHMFERDCSVQRRHQKIIEEAPAPGMTPDLRANLCAIAVRAARAVNYEGAGTIEFIADGSNGLAVDRIWFMEMNTRLQVEHPVTEAVTGLDLVEWQLRVASGEPLPLTQDQITLNGCAVEARLYAESPRNNFLPSTGPLTRFRLPDGVRVDTGVEEGGEVSSYYDPMIAKLIAHGDNRREAIGALAKACAAVEVWPVRTNAGFLSRLLAEPAFLAADIDTSFIETHLADLLPPGGPPAPVLQGAARLRLVPDGQDRSPPGDPWRHLSGFRLGAVLPVTVPLQTDGAIFDVTINGTEPSLEAIRIGDPFVVFDRGEAYGFTAPRFEGDLAGAAKGGAVLSPMPGRVAAMLVAVGDRVTAGQGLAVVEAMKMEYALAAPIDGIVAEIKVGLDGRVVEGQAVIRLEEA